MQEAEPKTTMRKRPWNRVNLPVYSISSKAGDNNNMHIITYALQISMKPKKKGDLPQKTCITCNRPFTWRKKWEKVWADVKYCSDKCKRDK